MAVTDTFNPGDVLLVHSGGFGRVIGLGEAIRGAGAPICSSPSRKEHPRWV